MSDWCTASHNCGSITNRHFFSYRKVLMDSCSFLALAVLAAWPANCRMPVHIVTELDFLLYTSKQYSGLWLHCQGYLQHNLDGSINQNTIVHIHRVYLTGTLFSRYRRQCEKKCWRYLHGLSCRPLKATDFINLPQDLAAKDYLC